jgi:uncharacterized protein
MAREARIERAEGGVVCERCLVADTFGLRLRGLLGRRELGSREGVLLWRTPSIHTSFMRFPIDAVFLDPDLSVVGVKAELKPWRLAGCRGARHVLELRSGEAARRELRAGERLRVIEPASATRAPAADAPIRVLLGASDRRFVRVATFLLARDGFAVSAAAARLGDLLASAERAEPDVVVLDATGPERFAARAAAALEERLPGLGVLIVADETAGGAVPSALPKWGSFDRLVEEIRRTGSARAVPEALA